LFVPKDATLPFTDEHAIAVRYQIPVIRDLDAMLAEWAPERPNLLRSA
jgi:hypothetical protein